MSQNNLIEIGSKANVILRFRQDLVENNEIKYKANEPYLFFKNANVIIDYSNEDKTGTAARTVIANSQINPRIVSIGSINLTRKLISLLTCFLGNEESFPLTLFETRKPTEENGTFYIIPNEPVKQNLKDQIFIYSEHDFERIDFTYDAATNRITSSEFQADTNYLVTYPSEQTGMSFSLNKNHVPYFSLEIQGLGNVDKQKKNIVMYFDKVSLNTAIEFNFIQDEIINVPLIFHIIENKNNYVWVEE